MRNQTEKRIISLLCKSGANVDELSGRLHQLKRILTKYDDLDSLKDVEDAMVALDTVFDKLQDVTCLYDDGE